MPGTVPHGTVDRRHGTDALQCAVMVLSLLMTHLLAPAGSLFPILMRTRAANVHIDHAAAVPLLEDDAIAQEVFAQLMRALFSQQALFAVGDMRVPNVPAFVQRLMRQGCRDKLKALLDVLLAHEEGMRGVLDSAATMRDEVLAGAGAVVREGMLPASAAAMRIVRESAKQRVLNITRHIVLCANEGASALAYLTYNACKLHPTIGAPLVSWVEGGSADAPTMDRAFALAFKTSAMDVLGCVVLEGENALDVNVEQMLLDVADDHTAMYFDHCRLGDIVAEQVAVLVRTHAPRMSPPVQRAGDAVLRYARAAGVARNAAGYDERMWSFIDLVSALARTFEHIGPIARGGAQLLAQVLPPGGIFVEHQRAHDGYPMVAAHAAAARDALLDWCEFRSAQRALHELERNQPRADVMLAAQERVRAAQAGLFGARRNNADRTAGLVALLYAVRQRHFAFSHVAARWRAGKVPTVAAVDAHGGWAGFAEHLGRADASAVFVTGANILPNIARVVRSVVGDGAQLDVDAINDVEGDFVAGVLPVHVPRAPPAAAPVQQAGAAAPAAAPVQQAAAMDVDGDGAGWGDEAVLADGVAPPVVNLVMNDAGWEVEEAALEAGVAMPLAPARAAGVPAVVGAFLRGEMPAWGTLTVGHAAARLRTSGARMGELRSVLSFHDAMVGPVRTLHDRFKVSERAVLLAELHAEADALDRDVAMAPDHERRGRVAREVVTLMDQITRAKALGLAVSSVRPGGDDVDAEDPEDELVVRLRAKVVHAFGLLGAHVPLGGRHALGVGHDVDLVDYAPLLARADHPMHAEWATLDGELRRATAEEVRTRRRVAQSENALREAKRVVAIQELALRNARDAHLVDDNDLQRAVRRKKRAQRRVKARKRQRTKAIRRRDAALAAARKAKALFFTPAERARYEQQPVAVQRAPLDQRQAPHLHIAAVNLFAGDGQRHAALRKSIDVKQRHIAGGRLADHRNHVRFDACTLSMLLAKVNSALKPDVRAQLGLTEDECAAEEAAFAGLLRSLVGHLDLNGALHLFGDAEELRGACALPVADLIVALGDTLLLGTVGNVERRNALFHAAWRHLFAGDLERLPANARVSSFLSDGYSMTLVYGGGRRFDGRGAADEHDDDDEDADADGAAAATAMQELRNHVWEEASRWLPNDARRAWEAHMRAVDARRAWLAGGNEGEEPREPGQLDDGVVTRVYAAVLLAMESVVALDPGSHNALGYRSLVSGNTALMYRELAAVHADSSLVGMGEPPPQDDERRELEADLRNANVVAMQHAGSHDKEAAYRRHLVRRANVPLPDGAAPRWHFGGLIKTHFVRHHQMSAYYAAEEKRLLDSPLHGHAAAGQPGRVRGAREPTSVQDVHDAVPHVGYGSTAAELVRHAAYVLGADARRALALYGASNAQARLILRQKLQKAKTLDIVASIITRKGVRFRQRRGVRGGHAGGRLPRVKYVIMGTWNGETCGISMRELARVLQTRYHVVLVTLDEYNTSRACNSDVCLWATPHHAPYRHAQRACERHCGQGRGEDGNCTHHPGHAHDQRIGDGDVHEDRFSLCCSNCGVTWARDLMAAGNMLWIVAVMVANGGERPHPFCPPGPPGVD